MSSTEG